MLLEHEKAQPSSSPEVKKHKASSSTKTRGHEALKTSPSTKDHVTFYTAKVPQGQHPETSSTHVKAGKGRTTVQRQTTVQHPTTEQHRTTHLAKPTKGISPADCDCGEFPRPCPCSTSKFDPIPTPKPRQSKTSDTKHTHPLPTIPMEDTSIQSIVSTTTTASITTTGTASGEHSSGEAPSIFAGHTKNTAIAIAVPTVLVLVALGAAVIWCYFGGWRKRDKVKAWLGRWICCSSRRKYTPPDITETTRNADYWSPTQPQPPEVREPENYYDDKLKDVLHQPARTQGLPYVNTIPGPAPIHLTTTPITRKPAPRMERYGEENPYTMNGIPIYQASREPSRSMF